MSRAALLLLSCILTACTTPGGGGGGSSDIDALAAFERAADPERRAIDRLRYAKVAIGSGELSQAQMADAYYYEGESYYYLRNYEHAIHSYREVLRISPDDAMTYGAIGHVEYMLRSYDDAIASYRRAYDLSGDRTWSDAIETARRDREKASRPPPEATGRDTRTVELIYIGFRAEKLQPDGPFKNTNEIRVGCDASAPGQISTFGFHEDRKGVKKGTRVVVNKLAWRGPIDSDVTIKLEVTELERDEGPKGQASQYIGKTTIRANPHAHLTKQWLSEHGFHYHIKCTMTGGGARYHMYFQFRSAR